jgi:hypothetical protein
LDVSLGIGKIIQELMGMQIGDGGINLLGRILFAGKIIPYLLFGAGKAAKIFQRSFFC